MIRASAARSQPHSPILSALVLLALAVPSLASAQTGPQIIDSYPREGDTHVPVDAELYYVFDRPIRTTGVFEIVDVDSLGGVQLQQDAPRYSATGDTVFLKPSFPMAYGHQHAMQVNTVQEAPPGSAFSINIGLLYFRAFPRATLEAVPSPSRFQAITLVPGERTLVESSVRETAGNAAVFTQARIELWAEPDATMSGVFTPQHLYVQTVPVFFRVPRMGAARLSAPVTVPREIARAAPDGDLGLRIVYEGIDETGLPLSFEALSSTVTTILAPDTATVVTMTPALLTPALGAYVTIRSVVLERPLPGALLAAGDSLVARGVVTGDGTGPFRAALYLDGDVIAIEEGYMESGRPVVIETRGPIPTRRLGEHRLQLVVESPQNVAAEPITILSVPPVHGLTPDPDAAAREAPAASPRRFTLESTWLADGRSRFRTHEPSVTGWAGWRARYEMSPTRALEARITSRVRVDDLENGSARPEQMLLRYSDRRAAVEWGDLAPALALNAPLLASPVPRRGAQATLEAAGLGTLEGYVAVETQPRSSGGRLREMRADLYAGRFSRTIGRVNAAIFAGYTHEDPTRDRDTSSLFSRAERAAQAVADSVTRARAIYGGTAVLRLASDWRLRADAASVRHRTIEGVETGRTRTGVKGELSGRAAGITARAEAFRYQPDLVTALNPYVVSDRRGFAVDLTRPIETWRVFAGYRRERPEDRGSGAPSVTAERLAVGTSVKLSEESWVTPALVRIRQKGIQTDFTQTRIATEFTAAEARGGRTTARFDVGTFEDAKGRDTKRRVLSGSVITTRSHPGRVTSTLSAGIEQNRNTDLDLQDMTLQATLEARWEAVERKLLVTPWVSFIGRDYELRGTQEDRLGGRLQISLLDLPGLGEDTALSVEGRVERIWLRVPEGTRDTEAGVSVSLGKRVSILP